MNLSARHPAALAFRSRLAPELGHDHGGVTVTVGACDSFGLVVRIDHLPVAAYHPLRLVEEDWWRWPLLSDKGRDLWDGVHALALRITRERLPEGSLTALILDPASADKAREGLRLARAA